MTISKQKQSTFGSLCIYPVKTTRHTGCMLKFKRVWPREVGPWPWPGS